jgi:uncharacterized protein YecE (DUF72 family)
MSKLFIGTSGWSYKHWAGIFYPSEIKPAQYLEYYLEKFDCVELNSSFYHLLQKKTIAGWIKRTPETFKFCPKLSRYITHQKKLTDIEEPMAKYFDLFEEMKMRLGPVLIQLPPGLAFDRSSTNDFLSLLERQYHSYRFAIEVRHRTWITDDFFNLLKKYGIAFVIADSGKRFPYHEVVTTDFVYLRFHGHESLYASDYSESDLTRYARKIENWLDQDKNVWVFFNNDYHGFAVKNAKQLKNIITIE